MAAFDPGALLWFFGALALAYGIGRLVRSVRARLRPPPPEPPPTRAERRRREHGRR